MSVYFKAWGGTLATCPDPSEWRPETQVVIGRTCNAKPVMQGLEAGIVMWNALSPAQFDNLYDTWATNSTVEGTFTIPDRSGTLATTWRTISGWAEPLQSVFAQRNRLQVTMRLVLTT